MSQKRLGRWVESGTWVGRLAFAGLVAVMTVGVVGCCGKAASSFGGSVSKGAKVQAPWSRNQNMYPGTVHETYGRLALIDFDDGDHGWAEIVKLQPPGVPGPMPSDTCAVRVGTKGQAPWSRSGSLYPGTVTEVYGKLAHINFDDGDQGWALCSAVVKLVLRTAHGPGWVERPRRRERPRSFDHESASVNAMRSGGIQST
jgi:hypothetical protein